MSRIKIKDLPQNVKMSKKDMIMVSGGALSFTNPTLSSRTSLINSFTRPTIVSSAKFNSGIGFQSMEKADEEEMMP